MSRLARNHPLQLVLGSLVIQEELATRGRQMTFAVLAQDCTAWAMQTRDVLHEIVRDADDGRLAVRELLADGEASAADRKQLDRIFAEIEIEAREGRIV